MYNPNIYGLIQLSGRIYIEISSLCNLRCIHCNSIVPTENVYLNQGELLKFAGILHGNSNINTYVITGGEPLLHKDFLDLIPEISKYGTTIVTTNGTCGKISEIIDLLKQNNNLILQLSMDGISKNVFESVRGKNTFHKISELIQAVIKNNLQNKFGLSMTVMKQNIHEAIDILNFAIDNNFRFMHYPALLPIGYAQSNWLNIAPDTDELIKLDEELLRRIAINRSKCKISVNRIDQILSRFNCTKSNCLTRMTLKVSPSGNIYPCPCSHSSIPAIENICNIKNFNSLIKNISDKLPLYNSLLACKNENCNKCNVNELCNSQFCGNCGMLGKKTRNTTEYFCKIYKHHFVNILDDLNLYQRMQNKRVQTQG